MNIRVKIENYRSSATDEYESYLIVIAKGKTQPYIYIPDGFDDEILDQIIYRIEAGNVESY